MAKAGDTFNNDRREFLSRGSSSILDGMSVRETISLGKAYCTKLFQRTDGADDSHGLSDAVFADVQNHLHSVVCLPWDMWRGCVDVDSASERLCS